MPKNIKLISTFDSNDTINVEVPEGETPESAALTELGWFIAPDGGEQAVEEQAE